MTLLQPRADTNGTNNDSPLQNSSFGSPLVIVFIAVAVCLSAGMSMYAWRRILLSPVNPMRTQMLRNRGEETVDLKNKPVLFDLWTRTGNHARVRWEGGEDEILPLAVTILETGTEDIGAGASAVHAKRPLNNDTHEKAQIAFGIIMPHEEPLKEGNQLGQYAIGVTVIPTAAGGTK